MNNTEMILSPGKEKGDPELPPTGLLLINPGETGAGLQMAKERQGHRCFLFNSNLVVVPADASTASFFAAGPAVGAPMAVLTLEKLIALGARRLIIYGWCGSLNDKLRTGEALLPTWSVSDEGTSAHYPLQSRPESHKATRMLLKEELTALGLNVTAGPMWTTDAPYRESKIRVTQLAQQGVVGVDMEFSALAAVAAFRKVELTAVMLVSDELWSGTWSPGFRTKDFKKKSRELLKYLMDFCSRLPEDR